MTCKPMNIGNSFSRLLNRLLTRQVKRFLICGSAAALTDMGTYYLFLMGMTPSPAKALSFICGAFIAYLGNKYFTFEQPVTCYREFSRFSALYLTTFMINVGTNKLSLLLFPGAVFLSFLIATFVTMVCNFLGQKFLVFRR